MAAVYKKAMREQLREMPLLSFNGGPRERSMGKPIVVGLDLCIGAGINVDRVAEYLSLKCRNYGINIVVAGGIEFRWGFRRMDFGRRKRHSGRLSRIGCRNH